MKYINESIIIALAIIRFSKAFEFNATREGNSLVIEVIIGTPPQITTLSIDSASPYTWVNESLAQLLSKQSYESAKSKSIRTNHDIVKLSVPYAAQELYAKFALENLLFDTEDTFLSFPLYLINDSLCQLSLSNGAIGLGRPFTNFHEASSFMNSLANSSYINYKVFTIQYYSNSKVQFSFGVISQDIADDYAHLALFNNSLSKSPHFGFCIDEIYIENKEQSYHLKGIEAAVIDYTSKYSYVPISLLIYLEKHLFDDLIQNEVCSMFVFDNGDYGFICTEIDQFKEKRLIIDIDKWTVSLQCAELFYVEAPRPNFVFGLRSERNVDKWLLGESFLKSYLTVFDFELNQLGFYHPNHTEYKGGNLNLIPPHIPTQPINLHQIKIMKIILCELFICLLIGIAFLLYRFLRRNKMKFNGNDYYTIEQ